MKDVNTVLVPVLCDAGPDQVGQNPHSKNGRLSTAKDLSQAEIRGKWENIIKYRNRQVR